MIETSFIQHFIHKNKLCGPDSKFSSFFFVFWEQSISKIRHNYCRSISFSIYLLHFRNVYTRDISNFNLYVHNTVCKSNFRKTIHFHIFFPWDLNEFHLCKGRYIVFDFAQILLHAFFFSFTCFVHLAYHQLRTTLDGYRVNSQCLSQI